MDERSKGETEGRRQKRDASPGRGGKGEGRDGHEADRHVDARRGEATHRPSHRVVARRRRAGDDDDRHRDHHREQRDER